MDFTLSLARAFVDADTKHLPIINRQIVLDYLWNQVSFKPIKSLSGTSSHGSRLCTIAVSGSFSL
jgi:hypothetical protein